MPEGNDHTSRPDDERRRLLGLIAKGGYTAPIALALLSQTPARASSGRETGRPPWAPGPPPGRGPVRPGRP